MVVNQYPEHMIIKCTSCGFNIWKSNPCPICELLATRWIAIQVDELDKTTMLSRNAQPEPLANSSGPAQRAGHSYTHRYTQPVDNS